MKLSPIVRTRLIVMAVSFLITFLAVVFSEAAAAPADDALESHKYADAVLLPRLTAALNDWHYQHPQDRQEKPWEHVHTTSAGDVKRYREITKTFDDWREAMKRAGY